MSTILASTDVAAYEEVWEQKSRRMTMKMKENEERLGSILGAPLQNLEQQLEAWEEKVENKIQQRRNSAVHMAYNQRQEEYRRKSIRVQEVQQVLEESDMLPTQPRNKQSVVKAAESLFAHLSMSVNKLPFSSADTAGKNNGTAPTGTEGGASSSIAKKGASGSPVIPLASKGSSSDLKEGGSQPVKDEPKDKALDGILNCLLALEPEDEIGYGPDGEPLYSYQELVRRNYCKEYCGLDEKVLEKYMTDRDFRLWFGVTKEEFEHQPQWKRIAKKKELLLF